MLPILERLYNGWLYGDLTVCGQKDLARDIANRWIKLNVDVFAVPVNDGEIQCGRY